VSKCDLFIDLHDTDVELGHVVRGVVRVVVSDEVTCDGLQIVPRWWTHGRCRKSTGELDEVQLFEGMWAPGTYEYAFSLPVDDAPLTYRGHNLNVDWEVKATADIPWAFDPKATAEFDVVRCAHERSHAFVDERTASNTIELGAAGSTLAVGCMAVFLMPFFVVGIGSIVGGVIALAGGSGIEGAFPIGFGLLFTAVPTVIAGVFVRRWMASKKVGDVDVVFSTDVVHPGARVEGKVCIAPPKDVSINAIQARLCGREVTVTGSGTNKTTHRHTLHEDAADLSHSGVLHGGMTNEFRFSFDVPEGAPPTFHSGSSEVRWEVQVDVDIPSWPDFDAAHRFNVG